MAVVHVSLLFLICEISGVLRKCVSDAALNLKLVSIKIPQRPRVTTPSLLSCNMRRISSSSSETASRNVGWSDAHFLRVKPEV